MNDTPNTNPTPNTETPNMENTTPGPNTKTPEKETYTKPDFKADPAFANLTAVTETSYQKIDILADICAICKKMNVPENFGLMLIDYYKFALDARQACPDRPKRAKSDLSNLQVVCAVMIAVERKCKKFAETGITAIQIRKFMENSEWKEHSILATPHPERTISSVLSVAYRKEGNDFVKENEITKCGKGYICQYIGEDGKPALAKPAGEIDYNLLA